MYSLGMLGSCLENMFFRPVSQMPAVGDPSFVTYSNASSPSASRAAR